MSQDRLAIAEKKTAYNGKRQERRIAWEMFEM